MKYCVDFTLCITYKSDNSERLHQRVVDPGILSEIDRAVLHFCYLFILIPRWRPRFWIFNKFFVVSTGFIDIFLITSIKYALCLYFLKFCSFKNVRLLKKKWKDKKVKVKSPNQRQIFQNNYEIAIVFTVKKRRNVLNFVLYKRISMLSVSRVHWSVSPITCPWRYPLDTKCLMNISLISTTKNWFVINALNRDCRPRIFRL